MNTCIQCGRETTWRRTIDGFICKACSEKPQPLTLEAAVAWCASRACRVEFMPHGLVAILVDGETFIGDGLIAAVAKAKGEGK